MSYMDIYAINGTLPSYAPLVKYNPSTLCDLRAFYASLNLSPVANGVLEMLFNDIGTINNIDVKNGFIAEDLLEDIKMRYLERTKGAMGSEYDLDLLQAKLEEILLGTCQIGRCIRLYEVVSTFF